MALPRRRSWLPAVMPILLVLVLSPQPGRAIPAFARKYGVKCYTCHTIPPALNKTGYMFKRLGYRMPPDEMDGTKAAPKVATLGNTLIQIVQLKGRLEALGESDRPQTRSTVMLDLTEKARRAAATDATVMILGESGTGKEVMARYIQSQSPRKNKPFVPVECSALPGSLIESELFGYERGAFTGAERTKKGLIESADGGTLFLDEIGDLSVELQTRLFRFVEERQLRRLGGLEPVGVDCRILCATNQDLAAKIKAGTFREELFYRLGVVTVKLPPLRDRPEDIPHLACFFLERFSRRYGKSLSGSPRFYEALLRQPWPGNVRQLKNVMERLTALHPGGVLEPEDLAEDLQPNGAVCQLSSLPWKEAREQYLASFELSYAQAVLAHCDGNISAAAREAGVDRKTFYALLRRSGE